MSHSALTSGSGSFLSVTLLICFAVGVGVRAHRWSRRTLAESDGRSPRNGRFTGRHHAKNVPPIARSARRRTDPSLPLGRRRR